MEKLRNQWGNENSKIRRRHNFHPYGILLTKSLKAFFIKSLNLIHQESQLYRSQEFCTISKEFQIFP